MYTIFRSAGFFFALIFFFGLPVKGVAQDGYQKGYVVTTTNDTLHGLVRDRKTGAFGKLYKKIKFKGNKGKSKYAAKEIIGYKRGSTTFESIQLIKSDGLFYDGYIASTAGDFRFLKVLEKGFVTYYQMEFEDADSGYIDSFSYFKKRSGNTLVRVNQGIFGLKRKKLAAFFSDCPELAQNIQKKQIKTPIEVVNFYNHWKAKNP